MRALVLTIAAIVAAAVPAMAGDAYGITDAERQACEGDATRLCMSEYPDPGRMLACMRANESSLTPECQATFRAGLARRGLN